MNAFGSKLCRGCNYPQADVWPFTIRESIPTIPIPLKLEDGDTLLDLQSCVSGIYNTNRYAMRVDYAKPPTPPFGDLDEEWVAKLLKKHREKLKK